MVVYDGGVPQMTSRARVTLAGDHTEKQVGGQRRCTLQKLSLYTPAGYP